MKWLIVTLICSMMVVLFCLGVSCQPSSRVASEWQADVWMQPDKRLPTEIPSRLLSLTDLPPLTPVPKPEDFLAASKKSKQAGCDSAVLTISWPALEPHEGQFTFEDLKAGVELNEGRVIYLGIQVINTTIKDLPADLDAKPFDDPDVLDRFRWLLDALAPLLKNRVRYLSIGNEIDIYLSTHPDETDAFGTFLNAAYYHAKSITPDLIVSTTLTDAGALQPDIHELTRFMDAHFLTYYHGQQGVEGTFKDPETTKHDILALAANLDERPIIFQEIGFPAHQSLGSPEKQAVFVSGVFDAWEELGDRVQMINYYMMYDLPKPFVRKLLSYYGISDEKDRLVNFLSSLGLHDSNGTARLGWEVFVRRGTELRYSGVQVD